jgi:predicted 3-demethylubiquinone-9 3-methyltransferase (glyoxalase superfamily)
MAKNVICLWYDGTAEDAAKFYAQTFPDSAVTAVHRAPSDYPNGKQGQVLTVEFTVLGVPCLGLNGGPAFRHSEAFSFQIVTDNQAETDRYWNAIVNNAGTESACGWCKDRWGLSWQITPRLLLDATTDPDRAAAKRAFEAMMKMKKSTSPPSKRRGAVLLALRARVAQAALCAFGHDYWKGRDSNPRPAYESGRSKKSVVISTTCHGASVAAARSTTEHDRFRCGLRASIISVFSISNLLPRYPNS